MGSSAAVSWVLPVRHRNYDRMPASVWIRCLQLLPYLEERGVRSLVNEGVGRTAVCVIVRRQDAEALDIARTARASGSRVVVDLCVNYFDETGVLAGGYGVTRHQVEECLRLVSVADVVTVASRYIEARAREFHPRVVYLPDSVDRRHFCLNKEYGGGGRRPGNGLRAIWCGNGAKAHELAPFLPALARRGIGLTVVSDSRPSLPMPLSFVRWRYRSAPADLLEGDVSIAPRVLDTPYNLGHSLFKVGVFLAQGVPAIASPVPSYREVVLHGRTGLLCASVAEWEEALDRVLAEPELLIGWSSEARETMRPYLTEAVVEGYVKLFRDLGA